MCTLRGGPGYLLFVLSVVLRATLCASSNCMGCTPLDSLTFDKVVRRFPATVVKFDTAYPYGDKHEEYEKLARELAETDDILVAEVQIKDYGEKENEELGNRYGVTKEQLPVVYVLVKDGATGKMDEFRFVDKDFNVASMRSFVRQKSGVYIALPGCLKEFDSLARDMISASDPGGKGKVMIEAERTLENLKDDGRRKKAQVYMAIMKRLVKDGRTFVDSELSRVKGILEKSKMSDEKKRQMEHRVNVLNSFLLAEKDEL